ncbi:energy transducer TonB [Candidatus Desantisbacteria bacterium]|nr:energy transducer TonB [Candidatus Desantisbacteria bacterium]
MVPKEENIKISKLIDTREVKDLIKPPDLGNEKKIKKDEPPKIIKQKILNKVEKLDEKIANLVPEPETEKKNDNKNEEKPASADDMKNIKDKEPYNAPSKIVIDESALSSKSSFKINFSESEVVIGKKAWIGYGIGTSSIPASMRGYSKTISKSTGHYGANNSNSDSSNTYNSSHLKMSRANDKMLNEKIYTASELDTIPECIDYINPVYPELARRMGIEGKINLKLLIDTEGKVKHVESIGMPGNIGFEESALNAAKKWKFAVPTINGHPVSIFLIQHLEFKLE